MVKLLWKDLDMSFSCSKEQIEKAKDWLVEGRTNRRFGVNSNYAVFNHEGEVDEFFNKQCHFDIRCPKIGNRVLVATENGWPRNKNLEYNEEPRKYIEEEKSGVETNGAKAFLEWLLSDRYWVSRFIVEKDFDFCWDYGFVVTADMPAPLMQNIMILSRHFKEVATEIFAEWHSLVQNGVREVTAYELLFNVASSYPKNRRLGFSWKQNNSGHHRVHALKTPQGIANEILEVVGGNTRLSPDIFYKSNSSYQGGSVFFDSGDSLFAKGFNNASTKEAQWAKKWFQKKSDEGKPTIPNPFSQEGPRNRNDYWPRANQWISLGAALDYDKMVTEELQKHQDIERNPNRNDQQ